MKNTLKQAQISYDLELLANLKEDHKILSSYLKSLSEAAKSQDLEHLPLLLDVFRSKMLAHVSEETLKLYVYLLSNLDSNSEQYKTIRGFQKEMSAILIEILNFLDSYKEIEKIHQTPHFQADLEQVIAMYNDRMTREESILFPLYTQMYSEIKG